MTVSEKTNSDRKTSKQQTEPTQKNVQKKHRKTEIKQTVAIRMSPQALEKARSLGKGYTSVLSRILEAALADNETLKHYL